MRWFLVITPFSEFPAPLSGVSRLDQMAGLVPLEWSLLEVALVQEPHTWPYAFLPDSGFVNAAREVPT